ncbi:MAG TPA: glycoside hydrolase family 3 protein, partial [Spirochaetes bacterium]|nr:glycoside hydrolase family 3 protein [Spirochaetota bacterium]
MNQLMEKMSLREKIGQLLCLHIKGIDYEDKDLDYLRVRNAITEEHIGGLILFHGEAKAAVRLLNGYQKLSRLPLLVSSDIERGVGQILKGGTEFPTNMAIGATFHPEFTRMQGRITAIEARAVGIHVAYAPVADVNSNPDNPIINIRSYGEDPNWVARFVEGYIQGVQGNDVLATAK